MFSGLIVGVFLSISNDIAVDTDLKTQFMYVIVIISILSSQQVFSCRKIPALYKHH